MPSNFIPHPSGSMAFGFLHEMRAPRIALPAGKIVLLRGRHIGTNRGFGAAHIWAEHSLEMERVGFQNIEQVANFVATIVRVGTPVYFGDHNNLKSLRAMAVRSKSGTAILEHRQSRDHSAYWSIVTAFAGTRTHGVRVGAVRDFLCPQ